MEEGCIFKSKSGNIQLEIKELKEINYGRLVWQFNFLIDDKIIENVNINKYSGLTENLKKYIFISKDEDRIFLPVESGYVLYNIQSKNFEKLPNNSVGLNNDFVGNYFTDTKLVINRKREVQLFDLENKTGINISFPFGKYQILGSEFSNDKFLINYKNLSDYKEYNKEYCLRMMNFI